MITTTFTQHAKLIQVEALSKFILYCVDVNIKLFKDNEV